MQKFKLFCFVFRWSLNCWAGILGTRLIGPYFFDGPALNGPRYLQFLQQDLDDLMENVPLALLNRHWFMQDGAPPHWAVAVRQHLNEASVSVRANRAPLDVSLASLIDRSTPSAGSGEAGPWRGRRGPPT